MSHPPAIACLAALLLLVAAPALADVRLAGEGFVVVLAPGGEPVHLEAAAEVPVTVSLRGAPAGAFEAAQRAFAAWEAALAASGAPLRFLLGSTTDEGRLCHRDGVNFVFWGECRDIARTRTYAEPGRPGVITGFDIVLDRRRPWGVAEDGRVGFDVESVLAHEVGHVLGLADVGDPEPAAPPSDPQRELTMYGWGRCGETSKRCLKDGDRRGIDFLYGGGGEPPRASDGPLQALKHPEP